MYRKFALAFVTAAMLAPTTSCGGAKRCTERTPASFATFLDDDWRAYCEEYHAHVESPANYSLVDLTEFFGEHPARVKELTKSLYAFDKYETCFKTPKEELELRNLQTCLQDNDQSDIEISNAWASQAEPWVEELQLRVQEVSPRISDAEREAKRQLKKVGESFDFHSRVEGQDWESLQVELKSIDKALAGVEGIDGEYKKVASKGTENAALVRVMESQVGPQVNAIAADVSSLRGRYDDLAKTAKYLEFAASSAGVPCPKSLKGARKELKIAKKIASGRNNEVGGSGVRILSKIRADASGDTDFERFEGYVCGIRGPENQFEGSNQLCGQYRYVIERQKPNGTKDWSDWTLKSFEESGASGGVDCALKKK